MIREQRASGAAYDGAADVYRLVCEAGEIASRETRQVHLLLDRTGYLVGIDLGGENLSRLVVMLGPHEAVAVQKASLATIARNGSDEIVYVDVPDARSVVRTDDRSPYR